MSASNWTAIYGPEPWLTTGGVTWGHWDGDLATLADAGRLYDGSDDERQLSHLDGLSARLRAAGLDASALAAHADERPALRSKARTKVLKRAIYERDLTDAMRSTPQRRLYERALRGRRDVLPASLAPGWSTSSAAVARQERDAQPRAPHRGAARRQRRRDRG